MVQVFDYVKRADDLLEAAWKARKWPTFIGVWLTSSVAMTVGFFVMFWTIGIVWAGISWTVQAVSGARFMPVAFPEFLDFTLRFCSVVALFCLVGTWIMLGMKDVMGDFRKAQE